MSPQRGGAPSGKQRSVVATAMRAILIFALVTGALPSAIASQDAFEPAAGMRPTLETYSFRDVEAAGIESLSLMTVPLTAEIRVGGRATVRVRGRYARAAMGRPDGSSVTVSGPTDTDLRIVVPLGADLAVLTGLVAIPTGDATHSFEEAEVAGAIAADLLPFRVTNWGTGGGFGGSLAVARPLGSFGVGVSAGYVVAGDFEPRVGEEVRYEPGDMLRVNGVMDRSLGDSKVSLRLSYQNYSEDVLGGTNLYRAGDRLEALGTVAFPVGRRSSALVYGGVLHRQRGSFLRDPRSAPSHSKIVICWTGNCLKLESGWRVF